MTRKLLVVFVFASICSLANASAVRPIMGYNPVGSNSSSECMSRNILKKDFHVTCSEDGDYFVEFWLLPAQYVSGKFTQFMVFVNDDYVDNISTNHSNWQSAILDKKDKISLKRGENVISIATYAPEVPNVERIRVSDTYDDVMIDSEPYENYISSLNAQGEFTCCDDEVEVEAVGECVTASTSGSGLWMLVKNIPLRYTFHSICLLNGGQDVNIKASCSDEPIYVDMIYFGGAYNVPVIGDSLIVGKNQNPIHVQSNSPIIGSDKPRFFYTPATSDEMQGLNWKFATSKDKIGEAYTIDRHVKIPKSGYYMMRLRTWRKNRVALATLNVNNQYLYEDIPVSNSYKYCVLGADGYDYTIVTASADSDVDDPMLFIHGAGADRVVGFNDDSSLSVKSDMGLYEAGIVQNYKYPISAINVCNNSSSNPESSCNVEIYRFRPNESPDNSSYVKARQTLGQEASCDTKIVDDNILVEVSSSARLDGSISVRSSSPIIKLSAFDLSGHRVGYIAGDRLNLIRVSMSGIGIIKPGIYMVQVETESGDKSKKIAIY